MRTSSATLDAANGVCSDTVFRSDFALKARIGADGAYLRFRQFGSGASFPAIRCAVLDAVKLIVSRCVPTKVCHLVVKRVAVVVASLHAFWSWPYKGFKHGFVRIDSLNLVVAPKPDKRPALLFVAGVNLQSSRSGVTDTPIARHLVQTFIPNNGKPSFHKIPHSLLTGIIAHG